MRWSQDLKYILNSFKKSCSKSCECVHCFTIYFRKLQANEVIYLDKMITTSKAYLLQKFVLFSKQDLTEVKSRWVQPAFPSPGERDLSSTQSALNVFNKVKFYLWGFHNPVNFGWNWWIIHKITTSLDMIRRQKTQDWGEVDRLTTGQSVHKIGHQILKMKLKNGWTF